MTDFFNKPDTPLRGDKLHEMEKDLDESILMKFSIKNNHLVLIISIISMAISLIAILVTCLFKLLE